MITPVKNPCANLVKTRQAVGMNQTDFWGRLGVKQSTGCRYEKGRELPEPMRMLVEVAYGLNGDKVVAKLRA
jgi:DNA-binding transcriptional regulator YiaG